MFSMWLEVFINYILIWFWSIFTNFLPDVTERDTLHRDKSSKLLTANFTTVLISIPSVFRKYQRIAMSNRASFDARSLDAWLIQFRSGKLCSISFSVNDLPSIPIIPNRKTTIGIQATHRNGRIASESPDFVRSLVLNVTNMRINQFPMALYWALMTSPFFLSWRQK